MNHLGPIDNTVQYSWFVEMANALFDFDEPQVDASNWESLWDRAEAAFQRPDWDDEVLTRSRLDAVFLTNDFDDPLSGFDTKRYIPCLRTDDLVFGLEREDVRSRLAAASRIDIGTSADLRDALGRLFEHFCRNGARACAISLPPDFAPEPVSVEQAAATVETVFHGSANLVGDQKQLLSNFVFWTLAEFCSEFSLPFDLMIGVHRQVYPKGVYQGQDLYDSRVSLYQYRRLFNNFPNVTFPISVLASVTNQELVSYAWIFPNVVAHGHWWYSNTPSFIERDLRGRLEAIPRTRADRLLQRYVQVGVCIAEVQYV